MEIIQYVQLRYSSNYAQENIYSKYFIYFIFTNGQINLA